MYLKRKHWQLYSEIYKNQVLAIALITDTLPMKCYLIDINVIRTSTIFEGSEVPLSLDVCRWPEDLETLTHHLRMVTFKHIWPFSWAFIKWHRCLTMVLKEKKPHCLFFSQSLSSWELHKAYRFGSWLWAVLSFPFTQDIYYFTHIFYMLILLSFKYCFQELLRVMEVKKKRYSNSS